MQVCALITQPSQTLSICIRDQARAVRFRAQSCMRHHITQTHSMHAKGDTEKEAHYDTILCVCMYAICVFLSTLITSEVS